MDNLTRLLMQGAAGAAGDATYVDDVFSTYLWKGDGQTGRPISNGIKLSNNNVGNSVDFYGSSGQLEVASTSDFAFGTDPFTIEFWLYFQSVTDYCAMFEGRPNSGNGSYLTFGFASGFLSSYSDSAYRTQGSSGTTAPTSGQWTHIALVREGTGTNQEKIYFNGIQVAQGTNPVNIGNQRCLIAGHAWSRGNFDGHISNYRVVKGQAIYTSNFTPSTQALTTTSQGAIASNVKLLCCNKNTVTGSTVTPGTIAVTGGSPTTSGFGPFTATDGEGGLVWMKSRTTGNVNVLFDTVRGANQRLRSDSHLAQNNTDTLQPSFTNSGFTVGWGNEVNGSGNDYTSWTFRKAKGFFDIIQYNGNATGSSSPARQIAHNLGSVPGCIMIKCITQNQSWAVYHRGIGNTKYLGLNGTTAATTSSAYWNNTDPTATHFTVKHDGQVNENGHTYIAYVFAGGNGTTDKAVEFDGTNDYLTVASSSDLTMGTGDFTVECWLTKDAQTHKGVWHISNATTGLDTNYGQTIALGYQSGVWQIYAGNSYQNSASYPIVPNKWYHAAYVRSGGTARLYINGVEVISMNDTVNYANTYMAIGGYYSTGYLHNGKISNLRVVKGQALYTSNFNVPHDPYTTTSNGAYSGNVKLLCCNGSTTTASTITPATITATGNPTVTTNNSIFDDTKANVFGEGGDQNIIKCGSWTGSGSAGLEVNVGFEPAWILFKDAEADENWNIFDSMRGIDTNSTSSGDKVLSPNSNTTEQSVDVLNVTPTGFELTSGSGGWNANGRTHIFLALRRPDGYVGKPAEAGTDVFAIDTGGGSSTIPDFDSGFPVDMALLTNVSTTDNNFVWSRLTGKDELRANAANAASTANCAVWDSNVGFGKCAFSSNSVAWMWKRGQGFDVVAYTGNYVTGRQMPHSMGVTPEMMWVKKRSSSSDGNWSVYHKGMNGGTDPEDYYTNLNGSDPEVNNFYRWADTAPNSTHFTLGTSGSVNDSGQTYIAMLFASVAGISKVGYYDGSSYSQTITTGFQPRFLIIRKSNGAGDWLVIDTTRGWAAGNDAYLMLNSNQAQATDTDFGAPTSTGFTLTVGSQWNASGSKYIYYAHA